MNIEEVKKELHEIIENDISSSGLDLFLFLLQNKSAHLWEHISDQKINTTPTEIVQEPETRLSSKHKINSEKISRAKSLVISETDIDCLIRLKNVLQNFTAGTDLALTFDELTSIEQGLTDLKSGSFSFWDNIPDQQKSEILDGLESIEAGQGEDAVDVIDSIKERIKKAK